MDYEYSRYPNPETHNDHQFLKNLYTCPPNGTEKTITDIAKKCFNMGDIGTFFFNARNKILSSVEVLMKEVTDMPSFSEAQQEITGAIYGLNLLLKNEKDEFKQIEMQKILKRVGLYRQLISDIFLIKEATKAKPELSHIVHDLDFVRDFRTLALLYGRKRTIDPPLIQSFMLVWMNPNLRPLLQGFLSSIYQTRESNLAMLKKDQLPLPEQEHNRTLIMISSQLSQTVPEQLEDIEDWKNFKILIDDLFNKSLLTNTQIHTDGLYLAFNAQAKDTLSKRTRGAMEESENSYRQTIQKLTQTPQDSSANQKDIENREKLKGYRSKSGGMLYHKAIWTPVIELKDPICPLMRTIGFATKEGNKNESTTHLDFTKAFLNLNPNELAMLSKLSNQCLSAVSQDAQVTQLWNEHQQLPPPIKDILMQFDNDQLPHLKNLSPSQREVLINEALCFASETSEQGVLTSFNFAKAFGEENLNLSSTEREMLSELLNQCDSAILQNLKTLENWKKTRELPQNIKDVLMKFDNVQLPHLQSLTPVQREMLVGEALRFALEVNFHLAQDLLTL